MEGIITWSMFASWFLTELCLQMSPHSYVKKLKLITLLRRTIKLIKQKVESGVDSL